VLQIVINIIETPEKSITRQLGKYIHKFKIVYRKNKKRVLTKFKSV
jgi:hypothetical protein